MKCAWFVAVSIIVGQPGLAADLVKPDRLNGVSAGTVAITNDERYHASYKGPVAVLDGRTLWYPQIGQRVRLADIDACELPQWAFDPKLHGQNARTAAYPVPCGSLAKAWLKRVVGNRPVECKILSYGSDGIPEGRCTSGSRDIAYEMLRVGWARVTLFGSTQYMASQRYAMAARYGMWATYVLDMNEWRRKAIDRTLDRRPPADANLLAERESEISPPFVDYRNRPRSTDR